MRDRDGPPLRAVFASAAVPMTPTMPLPTAPPLPPARPTPVARDERMQALDVLRGLALAGILLMNLEAFAGGLTRSMTALDPSLRGADRTVDAWVLLLVQGKFYPLFALLFGMGFALMARRAGALPAGARPPSAPPPSVFTRLYARRLAALAVIGLLHIVLVWSGDILLGYAAVGVLLLALREVPTRALPGLAALSLAFGVGLWTLMGAMAAFAAGHGLVDPGAETLAQVLAREQRVILSGTWGEAMHARIDDLGWIVAGLPLFAGIVLAMFLLGRWAIERDVLAGAPPRLLAWLRWGALPAGLALTLASLSVAPQLDPFTPTLAETLAEAMRMLGGVLQCLGYVAWGLRALEVPALARALAVVAPAGRMALTLYLLQSLACTWLLGAYGAGLAEVLPRAWQPAFALLLFAVQVAFAHAWFAHARFGPAEWLWRWATYGVRPPLRADA